MARKPTAATALASRDTAAQKPIAPAFTRTSAATNSSGAGMPSRVSEAAMASRIVASSPPSSARKAAVTSSTSSGQSPSSASGRDSASRPPRSAVATSSGAGTPKSTR